MKYENIKRAHISRAEIAKAFGFKNRHSFNSTSANKRYMKGLDTMIGTIFEKMTVGQLVQFEIQSRFNPVTEEAKQELLTKLKRNR